MHINATEVGRALSQCSFWTPLRILFFLDFQVKSPQNTKQKTENGVGENLRNFKILSRIFLKAVYKRSCIAVDQLQLKN